MFSFECAVKDQSDLCNLSDCINKCEESVKIRAGNCILNAKSLLGLFSLNLGEIITVEVETQADLDKVINYYRKED